MSYECPECGKQFDSKLLYEKHLVLNSEENYLSTLINVASTEIANGRHLEIQPLIDNVVQPRLSTIKDKRRKSGGYAKNKKDRPLNNKHKK